MSGRICSLCHGLGEDVIIKCRDCNGTGYDTSEWDYKPFAQCHTCYGDGEEEVDICPDCGGCEVFCYEEEIEDMDYDEEEEMEDIDYKEDFEEQLKLFVETLEEYITTEDGQWAIKGFIDTYQNIYTISNDTKIVSKILEIHLFPKILEFANTYDYKVVLAEHQNYYPDVSLVKIDDENIKFAIDFKTTYRNPKKPFLCNGFTLGSHGTYFEDRTSSKNIQFPYGEYLAHFCLGIIYDRNENATIDETKTYNINQLNSIESVVNNFKFFAVEKWKIASDKGGSGNTANIGSINNIEDISNGYGIFSKLGEEWFDDYWMNFNKIIISDKEGNTKKINTLIDFVEYRNGDTSLIVPKNNKSQK